MTGKKDSVLDYWIEVPIRYLNLCKSNPVKFCRDVANEPTEAISPFFRNKEKIHKCMTRNLLNPFNEEEFTLDDWWVIKEDDLAFRYIHVDLAKSIDSAGIACAHCKKFVPSERYVNIDGEVYREETMLPFIEIDYLGVITAKEGEEIDAMAFVDIIEETTNRGAFINLVTFDSYQSQAPIKALRDLGYTAGVLSIDRTSYRLIVDTTKNFNLRKESTDGDISAAMNTLKNAFYDERIIIPYHELLIKECERLELVETTGRVEKSVGSSDDLVQPVAGAVFNLTNNEIYFEEGVEDKTMDTDMMLKEKQYYEFRERQDEEIMELIKNERGDYGKIY